MPPPPQTAKTKLERLNAMGRAEAGAVLASACGSKRWVEGMLGRRPFGDAAALLKAGDEVWFGLGREDWLEAFSHHPRIGERDLAKLGAGAAQAGKEQSGMAAASEAQRAEFAAGNVEYERRFGHVFLICASGKTAEEMLLHLRRRLGKDGGQELAIAAREQSLITRLRLERWLAS